MTSEKRAPYPRESVTIRNFWRHPAPIFHRRFSGPGSDGLGGTFCDPSNLRRDIPCGHAMPVEMARRIARPCRKCWPIEEVPA